MRDCQIVIMAQGHQRRLPELGGRPKHLLPVAGEPILARTLRLLAHLRTPGGIRPATVVIGPPALDEAITGHVVRETLAKPGSCIVTGIRAALESSFVRQTGRVAVLLGDVVWSRRHLARLLADARPLVFAGTPVLTNSLGEVFATVFDDPQAVKRLCETCPCVKPRWRQMQGGHLRRLLWHAMLEAKLVHPQRSRGLQWWHPDLYLPNVGGEWTTDVDKPADLARLPELGENARREDAAVRPTGAGTPSLPV